METLWAATILKPRYHNIKVLFHKSLPQKDLVCRAWLLRSHLWCYRFYTGVLLHHLLFGVLIRFPISFCLCRCQTSWRQRHIRAKVHRKDDLHFVSSGCSWSVEFPVYCQKIRVSQSRWRSKVGTLIGTFQTHASIFRPAGFLILSVLKRIFEWQETKRVY